MAPRDRLGLLTPDTVAEFAQLPKSIVRTECVADDAVSGEPVWT
jgi:hypothetical protein